MKAGRTGGIVHTRKNTTVRSDSESCTNASSRLVKRVEREEKA